MKITRRHMLMGAGGAAVAVGAVGSMKLGWDSKNFTREGYV